MNATDRLGSATVEFAKIEEQFNAAREKFHGAIVAAYSAGVRRQHIHQITGYSRPYIHRLTADVVRGSGT